MFLFLPEKIKTFYSIFLYVTADAGFLKNWFFNITDRILEIKVSFVIFILLRQKLPLVTF